MQETKNATIDELAEVNRAQIGHRAIWMALIYDELKKEGIDAEKILRKAVKRCGHIFGKDIRKRCPDTFDINDFKNAFLNDVSVKTFDMCININKTAQEENEALCIDFHYCALVNAWKKLGFDDKTCELLCDIAMDGDRGIAEEMGIQFELTETIAEGKPECKLNFRK